jgi:mono/diheme cytochrome c family protein
VTNGCCGRPAAFAKAPAARKGLRCVLLAGLACLGATSPAFAQGAEQFFNNNCAACHTIGRGKLTGPDLKDVTARRDRAWLERFIADPAAMIASGDPYILKLQQESYGITMPTLPGLTPELIKGLVDYIDRQSGGGAAAAAEAPGASAELQISEEPAPAADVEASRAIFTDRRRLTAGGPACMSCHSVFDLGGLGGGKLAPDLTLVAQRLGHRQGLTAWLSAPGTPTMASVFATRALTPEEIKPLAAYLDQSVHQYANPDSRGSATFAALGVGAAFAGLVVMNTAWRKRLRSVRRLLVDRARKASLPRSK